MFLNIITPCCRPENLHTISKSINIPQTNYRWLVVFDMDNFPSNELIPDNCEIYLHRDVNSVAGHSQRNSVLNIISSGHVYMNDDDTIIHLSLWDEIKNLNHDFISFSQEDKNGALRLNGNVIKPGYIDSHNFIVSRDLIENDTWIPNLYEADGYFAEKMFTKTNNNPTFTSTFIPKILSTYNSLR
jgi:hypothetical protein